MVDAVLHFLRVKSANFILHDQFFESSVSFFHFDAAYSVTEQIAKVYMMSYLQRKVFSN